MNSSEIAFKAAQVMSEKGHCKYIRQDEEGRVCFSGAVFTAAGTGGNQWYHWNDKQYREILRAWDEIAAAAHAVLAERGTESAQASAERGVLDYVQPHWAVNYNNRSDVTGEDVILLLKQCGGQLAGKDER